MENVFLACAFHSLPASVLEFPKEASWKEYIQMTLDTKFLKPQLLAFYKNPVKFLPPHAQTSQTLSPAPGPCALASRPCRTNNLHLPSLDDLPMRDLHQKMPLTSTDALHLRAQRRRFQRVLFDLLVSLGKG